MRIVYGLIGLLLLPCAVAVTRSLLALMGALRTAPDASLTVPIWAAGLGFTGAIVLLLVLPAPMRTYVLAHELTHALWGALMGSRISGFRVSQTGGYVKLSQNNIWITLAPYFFPLYTVLVMLVYGAVALFVDLRGTAALWFGLIGITLGFHVVCTGYALKQGQADIRVYGRLLSYVLIYLMNLLVVCVLMALVGWVTWGHLVRQLFFDLTDTWLVCLPAALNAVRKLLAWLQSR